MLKKSILLLTFFLFFNVVAANTIITDNGVFTSGNYSGDWHLNKTDWTKVQNLPAGFSDDIDNDTRYTNGTGILLNNNQFNLSTDYTSSLYCLLTGCTITGNFNLTNGSNLTLGYNQSIYLGSSFNQMYASEGENVYVSAGNDLVYDVPGSVIYLTSQIFSQDSYSFCLDYPNCTMGLEVSGINGYYNSEYGSLSITAVNDSGVREGLIFETGANNDQILLYSNTGADLNLTKDASGGSFMNLILDGGNISALSGIICDSNGCIGSGSANFTNVSFINNTETITGEKTFDTNVNFNQDRELHFLNSIDGGADTINTTIRNGNVIQESTGYYFRGTVFGYPWNIIFSQPGGTQYTSGHSVTGGTYLGVGTTWVTNNTGDQVSYYMRPMSSLSKELEIYDDQGNNYTIYNTTGKKVQFLSFLEATDLNASGIICDSNGCIGSGGFTTDQNDKLNTTGSPEFVNLNLSGNLNFANDESIEHSDGLIDVVGSGGSNDQTLRIDVDDSLGVGLQSTGSVDAIDFQSPVLNSVAITLDSTDHIIDNKQNGISGGGSGYLRILSFDPFIETDNDQTGTLSGVFARLRLGTASGNITNDVRSIQAEVQDRGAGDVSESYAFYGVFSQSTGGSGTYNIYSGLKLNTGVGASTMNNLRNLWIPSPSVGAGSLGNNYAIYVQDQSAGSTDNGIRLLGADDGVIVIDEDDNRGAIIFGEGQDIPMFYNSSNDSLQVNGNFKVEGDLMYGGALVSFSPQVFCSAHDNICMGIDFKTKTTTWCSLVDGKCEDGNKEVETKISRIITEREQKASYMMEKEACEDDSHIFVSFEEYKTGGETCSYSEEKLQEIKINEKANCENQGYYKYDNSTRSCEYSEKMACEGENDWNYWDGSSCKVNSMRECIFNPERKLYSFDVNSGSCVLDPIKVCEDSDDKSWVDGECVLDPIKQKNSQIKDCLADRSKVWNGANCVEVSVAISG